MLLRRRRQDYARVDNAGIRGSLARGESWSLPPSNHRLDGISLVTGARSGNSDRYWDGSEGVLYLLKSPIYHQNMFVFIP